MTDLQDRAELIDLVTKLNRWLDDGPAEAGSDIYTKDAVVNSPRGTARGIDEILEYVSGNGSDAERTQHFTSDIRIEAHGDSAEVTANLLVSFYPADGEFPTALRLVGLRYAFEAVRTSVGWRFARASITPRWRREP